MEPTDKEFSRKVVMKEYPLPYCNAQTDPRNRIKTHPKKKFFFFFDFYYYFSHTRVNFTFCLTCLILVWIPFKSRRPLYVLKEITKKLGQKNIRKYFAAPQKFSKTFHGPSIYA